jgi:hypothetical protein
MIMNPCDECRYFNHAKGLWETLPSHWVHVDAWVGVGFADATAVNRGVQHYVDNFNMVIVGGYENEELDFGGCEAVGVGGFHSDEYGDGDMCQWCGLCP